MTNHPISIVIIDDHPVVRHGLKNIFNKQEQFVVAGEAKDDEEAVDVVSRIKPDVIILDISLGDSDGIDLIENLIGLSPQAKIIMYTMHCNKDLVAWSLQAGARGYMLKSDKTGEVVQAINDVFQGKLYLSTSIPSAIIAELDI